MNALLDAEASTDDLECVSSDDLEDALLFMKTVHWVAAGVLMYAEMHNWIWRPLVDYCRRRKMPCCRGSNMGILD